MHTENVVEHFSPNLDIQVGAEVAARLKLDMQGLTQPQSYHVSNDLGEAGSVCMEFPPLPAAKNVAHRPKAEHPGLESLATFHFTYFPISMVKIKHKYDFFVTGT